MPISATDALAALNTGISEAGGDAPISASAEETNNENTEPVVGEDAPDGGENAPTGEEGAGSGSRADDSDGDKGESGDEDGKSGEKGEADGEGKPGDKSAAKDGEGVKKKAEGEPPAKVKDPINDPLPSTLKEATRERITSLVKIAKDLTSARDQALAQRDEIMTLIQETGSTPEQYGQALDFLRMVNSGNRVDQEKALTLMQQEVAALSRILGVPVAGVDLLTNHADLQKQVSDGEISRANAEEIAAARESRKFHSAKDARASEQQQTDRQYDAAVTKAKADLNAFEASVANDPKFKLYRTTLVKQMQAVFEDIHPSKWAAKFKAAYDALPNVPAPRQPALGGNGNGAKPNNNPLRPKNPAGGQQKAISSPLEALNAGIAAASGK
jgi:hypothetical protein